MSVTCSRGLATGTEKVIGTHQKVTDLTHDAIDFNRSFAVGWSEGKDGKREEKERVEDGCGCQLKLYPVAAAPPDFSIHWIGMFLLCFLPAFLNKQYQ